MLLSENPTAPWQEVEMDYSSITDKTTDDESLRALREVEAINNSRPRTSMSDSPRNLEPLRQIIFSFLRVKFHYPLGYFRDQTCIADADGSRYGKWPVCSWHHGLGSIFLQERQKWLKQKRRCVNCGPYNPDGIMDVGKGDWHNGVVRSPTLKNKDKHRG